MKCLTEGELQGFADGELTGRDRNEAERHLAICHMCRVRLQELRNLAETARAELETLNPPTVEVPIWTPSFGSETLLHGEHPWERGMRRKRVFRLTAVAAVAAAAVIVLSIVRSHHSDKDAAAIANECRFWQTSDLAEDPQRMWQEGSVVITIVDREAGTVAHVITSPSGDRIMHREIGAPAAFQQNSSDQSGGI